MPLLLLLRSGSIGSVVAPAPALFGVGQLGETQLGDVRRSGGCDVVGRLVDASGAPIAGALIRFTPQPSRDLVGQRSSSVSLASITPVTVATDVSGVFQVTLLDPGNIWPQVTSLPVLVEAPFGVRFLFLLAPGLTVATTVTGFPAPGLFAPLPVDTLTELVVDSSGTPLTDARVELVVDGPPLSVLFDSTIVAHGAPINRLTDNHGLLSVGLISSLAPTAQVRISSGQMSVLRPVVHTRFSRSAQMAVTGFELTDAVRPYRGDGRRADLSTGIFPSSQNFNPNGDLELGITGYSVKTS